MLKILAHTNIFDPKILIHLVQKGIIKIIIKFFDIFFTCFNVY